MSQSSKTRRAVQWCGLLLGPVLALGCHAMLPEEYRDVEGRLIEFSSAGRATLAAMVLMGTWWLTEAIEIWATALVPLALFPAIGVADMPTAAAPYANPLIFLFMGGFVLALSMQKWQLDRRIALNTLRLVGTRPTQMVGGFMFITAVLSAFVSNTATTAMMLPIALSVVKLTEGGRRGSGAGDQENAELGSDRFGPCLMLGIAYAASIGGVTTIIGSPPNLVLVGFLRESIAEPYRHEISFVSWMRIGVPLAVAFLPLAWLLLTRFLYPIQNMQLPGGKQLIRSAIESLGKTKPAEWTTLVVFLIAATAWITRPLLVELQWSSGGETLRPFSGLTDPGIAIIAALALFMIPVDFKSRRFVMDWKTAQQLPWGILILFGGGLSLASAVTDNGVAEFLGSHARSLAGMPPVLAVAIVTTGVIFLTELTSNLATAATSLPILAALAPALNMNPYLLVFPATFAASCAFMLPVATPPNAIVFGSGYVTLPQMLRAGLWLNVVGIMLVVLLTVGVIAPMFGDSP